MSLSIDRRVLILGLAAAAAPAGLSAAPVAPVVTILGDSITSGLGVPSGQTMPARLREALERRGLRVVVRSAGVAGDTSRGGLHRVDRAVAADTTVCVVALGGNDLLRGADPAETKANLRGIVLGLKARRIGVLLAGLRAPGLLGAGYARSFTGLYAELARELEVGLVPNLLTGVLGDRRHMQSDGIHPNALGAAVIAETLAPAVAQALAVGRG